MVTLYYTTVYNTVQCKVYYDPTYCIIIMIIMSGCCHSCVNSHLRRIKRSWSDQLTPGDFHLQNKKDAWWHWEVQDQERRWQIIDHSGARLVSRDSGVGLQECLTIRTSGLSLLRPVLPPGLLSSDQMYGALAVCLSGPLWPVQLLLLEELKLTGDV